MYLYILDRQKYVRLETTAPRIWCVALSSDSAWKHLARLCRNASTSACINLFPKESIALFHPETYRFLQNQKVVPEEDFRQMLMEIHPPQEVVVDSDDPPLWLNWLARYLPQAKVSVIARRKSEKNAGAAALFPATPAPASAPKLRVLTHRPLPLPPHHLTHKTVHNAIDFPKEFSPKDLFQEIEILSPNPLADPSARQALAPWFAQALWLDPLASPESPAAWRNHPAACAMQHADWTCFDPIDLIVDQTALGRIDGLLFNAPLWIDFLRQTPSHTSEFKRLAALLELAAANLPTGSRLCLVGWHASFQRIAPHSGFVREACFVLYPPEQPACVVAIGRKIWHQQSLPHQSFIYSSR